MLLYRFWDRRPARWVLPLFLLVWPTLATCSPFLAQTGAGAKSDPTAGYAGSARERFDGWLQAHPRALATADATRGLALAAARRSEMLALMETDPPEFLRQALDPAVREALPPEIRQLVEKPARGRGFFGAYCVFPEPGVHSEHRHSGGVAYEVRLNGTSYHAYVSGKWRDQPTADGIEIEGVALDDGLVIANSPPPSGGPSGDSGTAGDSPVLNGANTLLYIIARFSDEAADPIDDTTALNQMGVVNNFWLNNSSGATYIRGLVSSGQVMDIVHVVLPQPMSYGPTYANSFGALLNDARTAAAAAGFNYANYNLDVTVTSAQGFGYAGRAYIGAQGCHLVKGYTSLRTAGHELGHNLGLYHAEFWRTDSTQPFGKDSVPSGYVADRNNCEWVEYGHYFSVMSGQFGGDMDDATRPHYAPAEKVRLGWLSGAEIQAVSASGTVRLFRHDARATTGTPRAIRIATPATDYTGFNRYYWLGYRASAWSSAQNWVRNGVQFDVAQSGYGSDGAIMVDMTPFSKDVATPFFDPNSPPGSYWTIDNSDKLDGTLVVGRTFTDSAAGIHVTPLAVGNNGTNEDYIDVAINLGTFPGNRAPVVASFSCSTNRVGTGQTVNFAVAATDPDGDPLAYSWSFDEVQVWTASGLNTNTATKAWSTPGQYRVLVTVSDMKGGAGTASALVTVGTPANTGQIWGRVLWGGQPVYGARVWTSLGNTILQAWTESDGTYYLTDLAMGSNCTVYCAKSGLTFTPQFQNPVSLASSPVWGRDFHANEPWAGSGATTYSISGRVTDPVNGVAGAEVRAGGILALTDSSGNYTITNLLPGPYTVDASKDSWSFSPASQQVSISGANVTGKNFARVAPNSISGSFSGIPAGNNNPAPTVYLSNGRSVVATRGGSGGNRYWIYTLNNVPNGQFSVSAQLPGYEILPAGFANPLTVSGALNAVNFVGTTSGSSLGAITGRITHRSLPLPGVIVQAVSGGSGVGSAVTDSDGYYRIENLPPGSCTVSPALAGYSFSPGSIASLVPGTGNFTATGPVSPPSISSITASPAVVADASGTSTLTAIAGGAGPLTFRWDTVNAAGPVTFTANDSAAAAATVVSFRVPGSYTFRARVTDANKLFSTATATVVVSAGAGSLAVSPYQAQVPVGQTMLFRADAWDQLGNKITVTPAWSVAGGGAIDSNGVFTASSAGGPYTVTATAGSLSASAFVSVTGSVPPTPPTITAQPGNLFLAAGADATFTVSATGTAPMSFQWKFNGANLAGKTAASLTLANVQTANAGAYTVGITNAAGGTLSQPATLAVNNPPVLQPIADRTIHAGAIVSFPVSATDPDGSAQTLTYSLEPGAPPGAEINATNGWFRWASTTADAGTVNPIGVNVADNGLPRLTATRGFNIAVVPELKIASISLSNGLLNLVWNAAAGTTYRVQTKPDAAAPWNDAAPDVVASGPVAHWTEAAPNVPVFYRVRVLP